MGKKIIENGWLYEYEETAESQIINGYEVTGVRYVLGEKFNTSCKKALICKQRRIWSVVHVECISATCYQSR